MLQGDAGRDGGEGGVGKSAGGGSGSDGWAKMLHGEVDKKAAAKAAGGKWAKSIQNKKKAAEARAEVT